MLEARLSTSSIVAMVSSAGMFPGVFSILAAMAARAKVALVDMVPVFMMGTFPMSKLKINVEFSDLVTAS
jgi:hypothetical protein